jgi:hypothetical protein
MSDIPSDVVDTPNADPVAVRDFWLQCVQPVARRGALDKIPTRKAVTTRDRDIARTQNYHLTKVSIGMPHGYERIDWSA